MEKVVSLHVTLKDPKTYSQTERRYAGVVDPAGTNEPDPRKIEQLGAALPDEDLFKSVSFMSKWSDIVDLVSRFQESGVTQIVLETGADKKVIRQYAEKVLPHFKTRRR